MAKVSFEGFPTPRPNKGGTNTGDANATAADILTTKTGYVRGVKVNGSMPNRGTNSFSPSNASQPIPSGFYNGSGVVNPVTGTAATGDVISGKSFSSANGIGLTGNIPVLGSEVYAGWRQASVVTASMDGRVHLAIPSGAYLTGTSQQGGLMGVYKDDANFVAANIPAGTNMYGLVGTGTNAKRKATGTITPIAGSTYIVGYYTIKVSVRGLSFSPTQFQVTSNVVTNYLGAFTRTYTSGEPNKCYCVGISGGTTGFPFGVEPGVISSGCMTLYADGFDAVILWGLTTPASTVYTCGWEAYE